jgi:hypothetical protein
MRRTLAAAFAAAALFFAATPAAAVTSEHNHASTSEHPPDGLAWTCHNGEDYPYARACYAAKGDWFYVYDAKKDGYSAVIRWRVWNPQLTRVVRKGRIWNLTGGGTVGFENKELPEDQGSVGFEVCRGKHATGALYNCTDERLTGP